MTAPPGTTAVTPALEQLSSCQEQLIAALAAADRAGIDAAVAEMRLALASLERNPRTASLPALQEAVARQAVVREALRTRLAQARTALDALGIYATAYEAHGQLRYHAGR